MNYKQLPKIDLHCHLDGSVRPETIIELASIQGVDIPSQDIEVIRDLMIAPETCSNLLEYLKRFDLPLSVMQTQKKPWNVSPLKSMKMRHLKMLSIWKFVLALSYTESKV